MKQVEFNCDGRWADPSNTLIPQIDVEEGEVHEVSDALADLVVTNKRGKVVEPAAEEPAAEEPAAEEPAAEATPATADKAAAEKGKKSKGKK